MNSITVKASAKINLTLDVLGRMDNGYHLLESIFQSVGIYDFITVSKRLSGISLGCSVSGIPCDEKNIAHKAARLFFEETETDAGADIYIEKHIPSQAGLGGGSADGAAVLYALNKLYGTYLSIQELAEIGEKVSADTPFFLYGGTAFVRGIGEIIEPVRYIPPVDIVIAKGESGISTPLAYQMIDRLERHEKIDNKKFLKAIDKGRFPDNCNLCGNIFEKVTDCRDVFDIKKLMKRFDAKTAVMSGSGSSVFGIFENPKDAENCVQTLEKIYPFAVHCKAVTESISEIKGQKL